jgi:hypothetical protein
MNRTLTGDQRLTLVRLGTLLSRRLDTDRLANRPCQDPLVHALDHAIVAYYRQACGLGLEQEALALLHASGPDAHARQHERQPSLAA